MSSLAEPNWEALARHPHFRELVTSRRGAREKAVPDVV